MQRKALGGVEFIEQEVINVHAFYADNVAMLIKAELRYVQEGHRILTLFGRASGPGSCLPSDMVCIALGIGPLRPSSQGGCHRCALAAALEVGRKF